MKTVNLVFMVSITKIYSIGNCISQASVSLLQKSNISQAYEVNTDADV